MSFKKKIPSSPPHSSSSHHAVKIFGVSLSKLARQSSEHGIPTVCWEILRYLSSKERITTEGLFRVSAAQPEVSALVARLEAGEALVWDQHSPHLIGTLLKKWLIDLPEPVFPFSLYESLIAAIDDPGPVPRFAKLFKKMPVVNKALAEALLLFLSRVGATEVNQMTPQNLAVVFAPILLQPPRHKNDLLLLHANKGILVIRYLIDHVADLYPQAAAAQRILQSSKIDVSKQEPHMPLAPNELYTPFAAQLPTPSPSSSSPSSPSSPLASPSSSSSPSSSHPTTTTTTSSSSSASHPTTTTISSSSSSPASPVATSAASEGVEEERRVQLLKATLDGCIGQLLEKLDDISQEIQVSSSVGDAVALSKKIGSAFTLLFDQNICFEVSSQSSSTSSLFQSAPSSSSSSVSQ